MGAAQSVAARNAEKIVMARRQNPEGPVLQRQGWQAPPGVDALKKEVVALKERVDECNRELTYLKVHTHAGNSGGGGKKYRKGTKRASKKRST